MVPILLILIGLALLTVGAEALVRGASGLALRFGVPPFVVGLTVVGFGTSTPELGASVAAALRGASDIAVANVIGSNIFNIGAILGLTALLRPIPVRFVAVRTELLWTVGAALVPLAAIAQGGVLRRAVGGACLAALIVFTVRGFLLGKRSPEAPEPAMESRIADLAAPNAAPTRARLALWTAMVLGGLALLIGGAALLVDGAVDLAQRVGLSERVIGLTIVAAATSAPELATSLVAALRGKPELALGNILGSNVFNIFGILGLAAAITPQAVADQALRVDTPVMLAFSVALLIACATRSSISRVEGGVMLGAFAVYVGALLLVGTG